MLVPGKFLLPVIVRNSRAFEGLAFGLQRAACSLQLFSCMLISQAAFANVPSPFTTDIKPAPQATHLGGIIKDTIVVITGSTYRFTVDTPEDQGLVSTKPTVKELLEEITSRD